MEYTPLKVPIYTIGGDVLEMIKAFTFFSGSGTLTQSLPPLLLYKRPFSVATYSVLVFKGSIVIERI
jgi:hypothetical protein